jgi:hypothetical protein
VESFHKKFVKDTGNNTQKRIDEFNTQIITRCYERMVLDHAMSMHEKNQATKFVGQTANLKNCEPYEMEGSYWMQFKDMNLEELTQGYIDGPWKENGKGKSPSNFKLGLDLPERFYDAITMHVSENNSTVSTVSFGGYTCSKFEIEDRKVLFRCTNQYMGRSDWYDWCLFKRILNGEHTSCPGQLLGFIQYKTEGIVPNRNQYYAVVQSAKDQLSMDDLKRDFVCSFSVDSSNKKDLCVVPMESIVDTLFVFKDYGGSMGDYFCVLPRRHWSRFFGDQIERS